MNIDTYAEATEATAVYPPDRNTAVIYTVLGIVGEVGELVRKLVDYMPAEVIRADDDLSRLLMQMGILGDKFEAMKRQYRAGTKRLPEMPFDLSDAQRSALKKELGDIVWYWTRHACELKLTPSDVLSSNLIKLRDRADRGVLGGSGDNR